MMGPVGNLQPLSSIFTNWPNRHRKTPVLGVDRKTFELGVEYLSCGVRLFQDIALIQGGSQSRAFVGPMWSLSATGRGWRDLADDSRQLLVLFMRLRIVAPEELVQSSADAANRLIAVSQLLPTRSGRGHRKGQTEFNDALVAAGDGLNELAEVLRASPSAKLETESGDGLK
jgi:hypothetical protein